MKHSTTILAAIAFLAILAAAPGSSAGTPAGRRIDATDPRPTILVKRELARARAQNRKQAATIKAFVARSRGLLKELSVARAARAALCAASQDLDSRYAKVHEQLDEAQATISALTHPDEPALPTDLDWAFELSAWQVICDPGIPPKVWEATVPEPATAADPPTASAAEPPPAVVTDPPARVSASEPPAVTPRPAVPDPPTVSAPRNQPKSPW